MAVKSYPICCVQAAVEVIATAAKMDAVIARALAGKLEAAEVDALRAARGRALTFGKLQALVRGEAIGREAWALLRLLARATAATMTVLDGS